MHMSEVQTDSELAAFASGVSRCMCCCTTDTLCWSREAARVKGVDEFVKHLNAQASNAAIASQTQCILQRWHDLDAAGDAPTGGSSDSDSQADDDSKDLHSADADNLNEAESIHTHGEPWNMFFAATKYPCLCNACMMTTLLPAQPCK